MARKTKTKEPTLSEGTGIKVRVSTKIKPTARVLQARGIFDVQPTDESIVEWDVHLPLDGEWTIGLIVGPSGSGKTTIARELFGKELISGFAWGHDRSILDGFPAGMSIKDITTLLSRVGFASPPAWLRPHQVLSAGEQFRATLARALAEPRDLLVMDEFTSVVDRQVAQIGSHCIAKVMRRGQSPLKKFIALSCHYDIIDWLQPDWMYEPAVDKFTRRVLRPRPQLELVIRAVAYEAWHIFAPHHYLTKELNRTAHCYVGFVNGRPAVFDGVLPMPSGNVHRARRSSRRVTLPDFQGLGLGPIMGDQMGAAYAARGYRYFENPTHPSLIRARASDPKWKMVRRPGGGFSAHGDASITDMSKTRVYDRWIAGFEYVGEPMADRKLAAALIGVDE